MQSNPNAVIQVTGGGSGTGISALINGATDIANSSRKMKSTEKEKLKARYNTLGVEIACAKDGITIYLHPSNKVKELTLKQLSEIYKGNIKNWKEVGGADATIKLYGRENSSGTYVFFQENVVKGDYAANCQTLPGTAAVVNAVKKDPNAIGYGGAAYAEGIELCKVKKDDNSPAYLATAETIKTGEYPITRFLFMYLKSKPTGAMKAYIDWILSPEGQKLVVETGYFPVK
jgi:phosphate transport system substrate-binding protein